MSEDVLAILSQMPIDAAWCLSSQVAQSFWRLNCMMGRAVEAFRVDFIWRSLRLRQGTVDYNTFSPHFGVPTTCAVEEKSCQTRLSTRPKSIFAIWTKLATRSIAAWFLLFAHEIVAG